MFSRTKTLEEVIKEYRDEGARSIAVVPFNIYGLKYGHLVEIVSIPARVAFALTCPSEEELRRYSESRRGKLEGTGRFYLPDKGKPYAEYTKSYQPLSDLDSVVKSLRENQFEVVLEDSVDLNGVKPVIPRLQIA